MALPMPAAASTAAGDSVGGVMACRSEAVELGGVVGEDADARACVRRPIEEQVEQVGVVGWGRTGGRRGGPVAGPQQTLGRVAHAGARESTHVVVTGRAFPRGLVGGRELDPAAA